MIDRNPFGTYVVDADFKLREVSPGARQVFASVQPLIGRDFAEVLHQIWPEPFATTAITRFRHTLATGEAYAAPSTVEKRLDIDDVEAYDWRIERTMLPDGRWGVICHFYNLTDRHHWEARLRESEDRFRIMANGVPLIVWVHDAAGKLEFANDTYCSYFGVPKEEINDERWRLLTHPDDGTAYADAFLASVRDREPFHAEVRVRRGDGAWRWLESWAQPRFGDVGEYLGHVGTSADITPRKEAEQAVQEADKRKNEFLAMLAHELRNPLAPIRNAVQILTHPNVSSDQASAALQMIDRQSQAMVRLVDDLMDVSRIAHGKLVLRRQPVELASIIEQALDVARPVCERSALALVVAMPEEPLMVDADPLRLVQIFSNVLSNACKYNERGGHVWLTTTRHDSLVRVCVRDDGMGISTQQLPRIFDMFVQSPAALTKSQGGLGIGLALARSLAEAHGGSIVATSAGPGQGAAFTIDLPLVAPTQQPQAVVPSTTEGQTLHRGQRLLRDGHRVLLVEDNADTASSLAALLRLEGFHVSVVGDGDAALAAAAQAPPDIVLLDLGLPTISGHDVCRALRERPQGHHTTIVSISGWGQDSDRAQSKAAGFNAHLVKPVEIDALLRILQDRAGQT
jgi:PAS domain S-box-containing protein